MEQNKPSPNPSLFNIFVMHMAVDLPSVTPSYMEAEASPELIPDGFDYYAAGHVHKPYLERFKSGLLAYSGCAETVDYEEGEVRKGFYYVKVDEKGKATVAFVEFESTRKFVVLKEDFTGLMPSKITERAIRLVKSADEEGVVLIPVLDGTLPPEASRSEVDIMQIRNSATKALIVHPVVLLRESEVSEEIVRSIFESEFKDLKTKAFEYFLQIFSERYSREAAEKVARAAVSLIEPLTKKQDEKVKQTIEELAS